VTFLVIRLKKTKIAQEHNIHPTQVNLWKKELLANAGDIFETKQVPKPIDAQSDPDRLYAKIGQLNMELDWLKKIGDRLVAERHQWVESHQSIALTQQSVLLNISRSIMYQQQKQKRKWMITSSA
jgi:hypothetical protein